MTITFILNLQCPASYALGRVHALLKLTLLLTDYQVRVRVQNLQRPPTTPQKANFGHLPSLLTIIIMLDEKNIGKLRFLKEIKKLKMRRTLFKV